MLREEIRRVSGWQEHHRRLIGRLLLILIATLVVDAVGTLLVYLAERHAAPETDINTVGDAFFFTTVQLLTVSSQIKNPFTPFGRAVDIVLEVWAVLIVAGSAGAFASFLQDAS